MRSIRTASLLLAAIAAGCASSTTTTMATTTTGSAAAGAAVNPLFAPSTLPYLAPHFDLIKDEHYLPAFDRGMAEHVAEVEAIAFANRLIEEIEAALRRVAPEAEASAR